MATRAIGANQNLEADAVGRMPTIFCDRDVFQRNLNKLPFEVTHRLAGSPLFDLPRLVELAQEVASRKDHHRPFGDAYCLIGTPDPGQKALEGSTPITAVDETIRQIQHANGWIMLNHIERNPDYQGILESSICDVLELGGRELKNKIKWFEAIIFITSPGRATSYHVDRECAWLVQLRGEKEIHLFNRADKEVVPHEELERFWYVDNGAGTYKPQYESRAMVFQLKPGNGVHIPVNTPHWLKNGSDISISMNVNFVFHDRFLGKHLQSESSSPQTRVQPAATWRIRRRRCDQRVGLYSHSEG
jgi:mannose-6-phosphate isomerase-like protein (cupin superfamily)